VIRQPNKTNFTSETNGCVNTDGRVFPSGNLPGSYIILTEQEREELLRKFVENGSSETT
jgi:hypothetical protein